MNFRIIHNCDSDLCPADMIQGVYYVCKRRTIKRFEFGKGELYPTIKEAHSAMTAFLLARKDKAMLHVQLLPR